MEPIEGKPNRVLRSAELEWEDYTEGSVRFGDRTIPLGAHGGGTQIAVNLVELPPAKQSCPFHYHVREEEHVFVVSGRCAVRIGEGREEAGPGDYVCFPANTGVAHAVLNPFEEPCRMLVIGTVNQPDEVCVYPDSQKAYVRALKAMVPWPQPTLSYDHGEDNDTPAS